MITRYPEATALERDPVKKAIMTSLYGSEAMPKKVFGEGSPLLELFYEAMGTLAPAVWQLNTAFLAMWNPDATSYSWTLPDNFHVHTKVMVTVTEDITFEGNVYEIAQKKNLPSKQGRSIGANVTHSIDAYIVRELTRRCDYNKEQLLRVKTALCASIDDITPDMTDPDTQMVALLWSHYKKTGMLSARIFDYLTEDSVKAIPERSVVWKLIYSMPTKPFHVLSIHD